jgi:hypothetical protein
MRQVDGFAQAFDILSGVADPGAPSSASNCAGECGHADAEARRSVLTALPCATLVISLEPRQVDGFAQAFDILSGVADPAGHKRDFAGMSGREAAEEVCLSLAHAHTNTLSLFRTLSLAVSLCFYLSFSLSLALSRLLALALSLSLSLSFSLYLSLRWATPLTSPLSGERAYISL